MLLNFIHVYQIYLEIYTQVRNQATVKWNNYLILQKNTLLPTIYFGAYGDLFRYAMLFPFSKYVFILYLEFQFKSL